MIFKLSSIFIVVSIVSANESDGRLSRSVQRSARDTHCWVRVWDWPDNHCIEKENCVQWELDSEETHSLIACCKEHCTGTGVVSPENPTTVTWKQARKYKLPMGKYEGKRLKSMLKSKKKRKYLKKLLTDESCDIVTKEHIEVAFTHFNEKKRSTAPTATPTSSPTSQGPQPTAAPTSSPIAQGPHPDTGFEVIRQLEAVTEQESATIMISEQPDSTWQPSKVYRWDDMILGVKRMFETGVGDKKLWLADETDTNPTYGLVNIAAFLAQSMKETIKYDVCDENNWDATDSNAATNACGQLGQSYQDYKCPAGEEHMQCEVDPEMEIRASTSATWFGAPAPLFCAPKFRVPHAPKWNVGGSWCDPKVERDVNMTMEEYTQYMEDGEGCRDYEGQKDGKFEFCTGPSGERVGCPNHAAPAFDQEARTDVEGCCWWGRGVIQTTGVCNFGKFNYFMGAKAAVRGAPSLYPTINFCKTPDAICTSTEHPELKWIAGLFYWMESVEVYSDGWDYKQALREFVDQGMPDPGSDTGFIRAVSGIVNRGCHNPPCAAGSVDGGPDRAKNFKTVLKAMGLI